MTDHAVALSPAVIAPQERLRPEAGLRLNRWVIVAAVTFVAGQTDDERYERWDVCEDLAQQLVAKARKDAAKYPQHSCEVTLQRIRRAIEVKGWISVVETDWLMERLRTLLDW